MFLLEVEDMHIVELFGHFKDTSIDYHAVIINLGGVTASTQWLVIGFDMGP